MLVDDALHRGETHAGTLEIGRVVQALKCAERDLADIDLRIRRLADRTQS
jgi:hypothetical protein